MNPSILFHIFLYCSIASGFMYNVLLHCTFRQVVESLNHQLSHHYNCSYREVAHALGSLGLEKGSSIAIDMPMDVNAVVIYLAIVLAGYVVVSIADSFAPSEISTRLILSNAKAIFTQVLYLSNEDIILL